MLTISFTDLDLTVDSYLEAFRIIRRYPTWVISRDLNKIIFDDDIDSLTESRVRSILYYATHAGDMGRMMDVAKRSKFQIMKEENAKQRQEAKIVKKPGTIKAEKLVYFEEVTLPDLKKTGLLVELYQTNSYRIRGQQGKGKIDFYPPSGRMFVHATQSWHNVLKEDVLNMIKKHL